MKTIDRAWGFRAAALLAAAVVIPACHQSSSSGAGPNPGTINFLAAVFSVAENGAGTATVTVRRSGGSLGAVSVNYATSAASASDPADFTGTSGTLIWANGDSADKAFTVTIANDGVVEGSEFVGLTLSLPGGGAVLDANFTAVLEITDDDATPAGVLQFSAAVSSVAETAGTITVTVTRTGGNTGAVGVTYSSADVTATAGADYTAVPALSTLAWAAGDSAAKTFTVPILDDAGNEGDEAFNLTLSLPTGGASLGTVTGQAVTILDSDNNGTISLASAAFSANEAGVNAVIVLTRTGGSAGAVGVTIASAAGTATAATDYIEIPAATTVTWAAGDVDPKIVNIALSSDTVVEADETVNVTISAPTGSATLGATAAAVLTILDDDTTLQFSLAAYGMTEAGPVATITVTRLGSFAAPVGVSYATTDGTAASASDYTFAAGALAWAAGDGAAKTFDVPLTNDANPEADETVNLTISTPTGLGASLGVQTTAVLNILDNDASFVFSLAAYNVNEAAASVTVTVDRVGAASFAVAVDWTNPVGGTATGGGTDYTTVPATLNFAALDMSESFNVTIVSDNAAEGNETYNLGLANPTNAAGSAVLGTPNASVVTIVDDDINFRFSTASQDVSESTPTLTVTVQRLGLSVGAVSVQYQSATNNATAGFDYTAITPTTINWADGDTADKTFTVTILEDFLIEGTENFSVGLFNPLGPVGTSTTVVAPSNQNINILENDVAGTLQFSAATYSVGEAGPTATITVTRTGGVGNTVSAVVSTANDTATAGADYTALNGATGLVTFPAGSAVSQTVTIAIADDGLVEAGETVDLALGSFTGTATAGAQNTAELTILDDDVTLQFTSATYSVGENGTSISIPVSRVGRSTGAVSVSWSVTGGTAATPADFSATGTLSWADGVTANQNITVTIVNNVAIAADKTVQFTLATPTGGAGLGAISVATLTIQEDDAPGVLQFTAANFNVNEGNVNAQVTLSRSGGIGGMVSVDVTFPGLEPVPATAGVDYLASGAVTVTWAAGDGADKTFNIPIVGDAVSEGTETINLGLTNYTGGAGPSVQSATVVSILDSAGTISLTSSFFSIGEAGPNAVITVMRTGGRGGVVGATWTASDGTATSPGDFTAGSNTISFADNDEVVKQFLVPVVADTTGEGNESFGVALSLPTGGAAFGISSASVQITDDDTSYRFSSATYSVGEAGVTASITVQRVGLTSVASSVQFATSDGTAIAGTDYTATGTVTLPFGVSDTSLIMQVNITDDALTQGNLTFNVALSNPSGATTIISPSTATVTITEDDLPGTLALSSATYTVNENVATATITVTRTGGTGGAVSVNYTTTNGTATAPGDYATNTGTANFAAGIGTSETFDITIVNDPAAEGDQTVNITLSGNTPGTTLGLSSAILTIKDDDATIRLSSATYTVNEGGANLVVTIQRVDGSVGAVTARVTPSDGTATAGADYTAGAQDAVFADGDTADKSVLIPITEDVATDPNETINLALTVFAGNAGLGTPNTAVATIIDNEGPSIVSTLPADNATGVFRDTNYVITFSEAMNKSATEGAITFARSPGSSTLPTAAFSWSAGDTVLTIVFDTVAPSGGLANVFGDDLLADGTTYTVTVGVGATGAVSTLPLPAPSVTDFITVLDSTQPTVLSISPSLSTVITPGGPSTVFLVTFNEPMNTTQGQARIESPVFDGGSTPEDSIGGAGSGGMTVSWDSSTVFRITVAPGLPARTGFRLDVNSMNDVSGNFYNSSDLRFVTGNPGTDAVQPRVTGTIPTNGIGGVSRDAAVAIAFTEVMDPALVTKLTIGGAGAGVPVDIFYDVEEFAVLFIQPRRAWGIGTVTISIDCGASGAADVKGNILFTATPGVHVTSFTTVAGPDDAKALAVNAAASGIKNAATKVSEIGYTGFFKFLYAGTANPAAVDREGFAPRDVSLIDATTTLPVKGYRLEASGDDGELQIQRFTGSGISSLVPSRGYTLRLNSTLESSRGVALPAPLSFTFTVRSLAENVVVQFNRPPEIEIQTRASGDVGLNISVEVQNQDASPGQKSSVTVTAPAAFADTQESGTGSNFFNYDYETSGSDEPTLGSGSLTFNFSATDDGPSPDSVAITATGYVFDPAELNANLPAVTSSATPTFNWTWPTGLPANVHALIVHVSDAADPDIVLAEFLLSRTATTFTVPADRALSSGLRSFYLGALRFKDTNTNGGVTDVGIMGPVNFTVP